MSTTVIDRLHKLKEVSQQLKDCTLNTPLNIQKIRQLLSLTNTFHQKSNIKEHNFNKNNNIYQLISNDTNFKPLFSEQNDKQVVNHRENEGKEQEIINLRQQNIVLQEKIKVAQREIGRLQEQRMKWKSADSSLPYFKLSQVIQGFIGRLSIPVDNIDQLDYSAYEVELKLDSLILLRKQKGSIQQFDLTTLKDAQYRDNIILLKFQEFISDNEQTQANIVLKFNNIEQLHKWDLSIFINYHLVCSLNQPKLFESHFAMRRVREERNREDEKLREIREKKELDSRNQKDLLKLLIKKREDYLQIKNLVGEKLQHKLYESQLLESSGRNQDLKKAPGLDRQSSETTKINVWQKQKQKQKESQSRSTPRKTNFQGSKSIKQSTLKSGSKKISPIRQMLQLDTIQQQPQHNLIKQSIMGLLQPIPLQPQQPLVHQSQSLSISKPQDHNKYNKYTHSVTHSLAQPLTNILIKDQIIQEDKPYIYEMKQPQIQPFTINRNNNGNGNINGNLNGNGSIHPHHHTLNTHAMSNVYAYTDSAARRKSNQSIVNELNNSVISAKRQLFQTSNFNQSTVSSVNTTRFNSARINLQNGYMATKYSKDGFNPHDKKVFMSLDCKKLCWSEKDKLSEYKSIPLQVITKVDYGVLGEGVLKHVKDPVAEHYCVIQYLASGYKKKTMQLGSDNIISIKNLAFDLNIVVKKLKQDAAQ